MKKTTIITLIMLLTSCYCVIASCVAKGATPATLKCEYTLTPIGLDTPNPRLSWTIESSESGFKQGAFRILIASTPQLLRSGTGDIWDSGKIKSDNTMATYAGNKVLESYKRYYWGVEIWDQNGSACKNSAPTWFEMGKMPNENWTAKWITDSASMNHKPAPMFRHDFDATKKIAFARTYICGLGYYELFLNGKRVGDHLLDPGFTDFDKRNLYVTYDVTELLKSGKNSIGVILGNGWYNEQARAVWNFHRAPWRNRPRMICEIHVTYTDGTKEVINSDQNWKTATGALLYDNLYTGVIYDSRLEQTGWNMVGFDDSSWQNATITKQPAPIFEAQKMPAIGTSATIKPVSIQKINDTITIYNMGVNFAGVCQLKIKGPRGTVVTMRHGEILNNQGTVDQRNIAMHLRPADKSEIIQFDKYILKGEGVETFTPPFTYHGFKFVEVTTSTPISLDINSISGIVMHSDVTPIGDFACSNELINKIHDISKRSYLSNLFGIPTDCPHREKNGWMADGYMVQEAGMLGYDSRNVYAKWVKDMIDAQEENGNVPGIVPTSWKWDSNWAGPMWDAAIFMVPYQLYQYSGDIETIKDIYPTAKRYLEYLKTTEKENGTINQGLGDWLFYKAQTPVDFMGTCIYYWDNMRMAEFAVLSGHDNEAQQYLDKADKLKDIINREFFDAEKVSYSNGTQLSYALPLYVGVVPEKYRIQLAANLEKCVSANNYSLDFGFIGSLVVPIILSDYGYTEAVYKMTTKTTLPSWGYWIEETNATSLYETWDINRSIGDASRNHPSMGAISAWFYKSLGGINLDPSATGFKSMIIKPAFPEGLEWVRSSYDSQHGPISSAWSRKGDIVTLKLTIPANTTAKLELPSLKVSLTSGDKRFVEDVSVSGVVGSAPEIVTASVNAENATAYTAKPAKSAYNIGSGSYTFTIEL